MVTQKDEQGTSSLLVQKRQQIQNINFHKNNHQQSAAFVVYNNAFDSVEL